MKSGVKGKRAFSCPNSFLPGKGISKIPGFGSVFVLTLIASALLIAVLRRLVNTVGLRPVDRALGAIFGLVRGMVLLMFLVLLAGKTPLHRSADWQASWSVKVVAGWAKVVIPMLPSEVARYIPSAG